MGTFPSLLKTMETESDQPRGNLSLHAEAFKILLPSSESANKLVTMPGSLRGSKAAREKRNQISPEGSSSGRRYAGKPGPSCPPPAPHPLLEAQGLKTPGGRRSQRTKGFIWPTPYFLILKSAGILNRPFSFIRPAPPEKPDALGDTGLSPHDCGHLEQSGHCLWTAASSG